jgi:antitoxin (DNA-binding transcriptional repressor) of toxin-antitoxin stability system
MKVVGVRELKDHLSEYVRLVRAGEELILTDRGEVVAELRRADQSTVASAIDPGLAALAGRGGVLIGAANEAGLYPRLKRLMNAPSSLELLAVERGES